MIIELYVRINFNKLMIIIKVHGELGGGVGRRHGANSGKHCVKDPNHNHVTTH